MFIVMLGIQGSGKGTQADLLAKNLSIPHVSTGEMLRAMAQKDTPEGKKLKQTLDAGVYLSDEEMTAILKEELPQSCILDGYPRTLNQAHILDELRKVDVALYIELSDAEAMKRALNRGRTDDTPEAIKKRITQYHAAADTILSHYKKQKKLKTINGEQSIEAVFQDICKAITLKSH